MRFEEAQLIRKKALRVLKQYRIDHSVMWILNHFESAYPLEYYDMNEIERAQPFKYLENEYEMYCFNSSQYDNGGEFRLYVNKEIVLETRYNKFEDGWLIDLDLDHSEIVKLGDWVKELTEFVKYREIEVEQIKKIEEIEVKEYMKNLFIEETEENFDLGDFENE